MIQKMGSRKPTMNMIQWPFLSAVNANMTNTADAAATSASQGRRGGDGISRKG